MEKKKILNIINPAAVLMVIAFVFMIICAPETCTRGACMGIFICGKVIIPALFPFTVCVLFILKSGILKSLNFTSVFTEKVFNFSPEIFSVMLLSFIGGYPIGAKLINEMIFLKKIDSKTGGIMLNFCVNAGPAFIVLAVGSGIIGSKKIGYILLVSHIIGSLLLAIFFGRFLNSKKNPISIKESSLNAVDNFIISTSDAASTVLNICAFVILFSTISSYIELLSTKLAVIKNLTYILEVTNAVRLTDSILFISFLLGFGGICVWCQIISLGRNIQINIPVFILSRIIHGILSSALTLIIIKIFNLSVPTFSNTKNMYCNISYTTLTLSFSMLCMAIVLMISIYTKKSTGKILEDLV